MCPNIWSFFFFMDECNSNYACMNCQERYFRRSMDALVKLQIRSRAWCPPQIHEHAMHTIKILSTFFHLKFDSLINLATWIMLAQQFFYANQIQCQKNEEILGGTQSFTWNHRYILFLYIYYTITIMWRLPYRFNHDLVGAGCSFPQLKCEARRGW